jgi:hypothetical protein
MQVQVIPPKAPRKARKQETARYVVKWIVADTMYFQWFKRDSAAVAFLNRLLEDGVEARILMK